MSHSDNERASRRDARIVVQRHHNRPDSHEQAEVGDWDRPRTTSEPSRQSYPLCPIFSSKSTPDVTCSDWSSSGVSSSRDQKPKFTSGEFHLTGSPSSSRTSFEMKRLMSKPVSLTPSIPTNVRSPFGAFPTTSTSALNMGTKGSTTDSILPSTSAPSFPQSKFPYLEADIYASTSYTPRAPIPYRVPAALTDEVMGLQSHSCDDASRAETLPRNYKGSSSSSPIRGPAAIDSLPTVADESSSNMDTFSFPAVPQSHAAAASGAATNSITQPPTTHPAIVAKSRTLPTPGGVLMSPASQVTHDWPEWKHPQARPDLPHSRESDIDKNEFSSSSSNIRPARGIPLESKTGGKTISVEDELDRDAPGTPDLSASNHDTDGEVNLLPTGKPTRKVSRKLSKSRPQIRGNGTGRENHLASDLHPFPATRVNLPAKGHKPSPQNKSLSYGDGWRSWANLPNGSPQVAGRSSKPLRDTDITVLPPRREGALSRLMRKLSISTMRDPAGRGSPADDAPPVPPLPASAISSFHMRQRSSSTLLGKKDPDFPKEKTTVGSISSIFKRRTSVSSKSVAINCTKPGMDATSLSAWTNFSTNHSTSSLHRFPSRPSTSSSQLDEMLITPIEPVPPLPRASTMYTCGTPYPSQASSIPPGVHITYHHPNTLFHRFSMNNSSPQLIPSPSPSPSKQTEPDPSMIATLSGAKRDVEVAPKRSNSLRRKVSSLRKRAVLGDSQKADPTQNFKPLNHQKSREMLVGSKSAGDDESASRRFLSWRRSASRSRASSIDNSMQLDFNASLTNVSFLEIDPTTGDAPGGRWRKRTNDEKDAMWDELMKRSNDAGGTLQAVVGVRLESDSLE